MSTLEDRERITKYVEERFGKNDLRLNYTNSSKTVAAYHAFARHIKGEKGILVEVSGVQTEVGKVLAAHNGDVRTSLMDVVTLSYDVNSAIFPFIHKTLYPIFFENKSLEESGIKDEKPLGIIYASLTEYEHYDPFATRTSERKQEDKEK